MKRFTAVALALLLPVPADAALTEAARLSAAYDAILAASFDEAELQLKAACPPAPTEACQALRAVSLWWQILLNPHRRTLDERFERTVDAAIAASAAWTRREPERAEAWFYLAGARAPHVQWRILRGDRLAAAREGNRIREALERALELDRSLEDAHFGVGLYRYYADVAPSIVRVLRWLLLLPGGDREQGLAQMLQARARGELLSGEADYQLHFIYLWYEEQPARALELLRGLDARYPSNPIFLHRIAEVQRDYFSDHAASAASWQTLLDRATARTVNARELAETQARLGLAQALVDLMQPERALDTLAPLFAMEAIALHGGRARAHLIAARAHDRRGARSDASAQYRAAIAAAPDDDHDRVRARAKAALGRNF